jgi:CRISPR-associated protein Cas1
LFGYGINVRVDRGHLVVEDGIGADRRQARFARVTHGLQRLVVIGSDGAVSLAALRWLADQKAAFVMLDRDGSVLVTTGPVRPSDSRLRRAQALAHESSAAIEVCRMLIDRKLTEQARIASDVFRNDGAANSITSHRGRLTKATTTAAFRLVESQAALVYWGLWRGLSISFPRHDLPRVPDHWRTFKTRQSPLTNSGRLAINPVNAMLNYLYALLESEARLAAVALGLDPGLGMLHADTDARDSLACDLMEPVRPVVDAYVLRWVMTQPLQRDWFFETREGNCRLMGAFAAQLTESSRAWGQAVAPIAESVTKLLWSSVRTGTKRIGPPTRLTQQHRRQAKGESALLRETPPRAPKTCPVCGASPVHGTYCEKCAVVTSAERMVEVAKAGRIAAQGASARARLTASRRRNAEKEAAWNPADQPVWLTEAVYTSEIAPRLASIPTSTLARAMSVTRGYISQIRRGRYRPHPRHWVVLATLTAVDPTTANLASKRPYRTGGVSEEAP